MMSDEDLSNAQNEKEKEKDIDINDALNEQDEDWSGASNEQAEAEAQEDPGTDWGDALNEQAEAEAQEDPGTDWGDALNEQAEAEADAGWGDALNEQAETESKEKAEKAKLKNLKEQRSNPDDNVDLDVLLDIPVTLQLEIGRSQVPIRSLLSYTQGSIVEMDRMAGEPLDLLVNGTLIAHGEVVVINDKFGVRLTDVISPQERIKKLK
jgi:flagellar motor switch protein FliN/FliY